jgi:lysophospholipase L1-like esterase
LHETLKYYYELPKENSVEPFKNTAPRQAKYHINNQGLHDLYDYEEKKKSDVQRIITLGDSFTFGLYIETEDNWTEQLEKTLNQTTCGKYEIINLGVYGYDFRYAYERYVQLGEKFNPDLVIWLFADADRINEELFSRIDKNEKPTYTSLIQAQKEYMKEWSSNRIATYQYSIFRSFSSKYTSKQILFTMPWYSLEFKSMIKLLQEDNSSFFASNGIEEVITKKNLIFENDGHPNREGHRAMANVISQEVLRRLPPVCYTK